MASGTCARYELLDRYEPPPPAGMRISAVAVLRRGRKVPLGRATRSPCWRKEWPTTFQA